MDIKEQELLVWMLHIALIPIYGPSDIAICHLTLQLAAIFQTTI